ncbi:hypothetical protein CSUI_006662, partial [Cystoisospora suis]
LGTLLRSRDIGSLDSILVTLLKVDIPPLDSRMQRDSSRIS